MKNPLARKAQAFLKTHVRLSSGDKVKSRGNAKVLNKGFSIEPFIYIKEEIRK